MRTAWGFSIRPPLRPLASIFSAVVGAWCAGPRLGIFVRASGLSSGGSSFPFFLPPAVACRAWRLVPRLDFPCRRLRSALAPRCSWRRRGRGRRGRSGTERYTARCERCPPGRPGSLAMLWPGVLWRPRNRTFSPASPRGCDLRCDIVYVVVCVCVCVCC